MNELSHIEEKNKTQGGADSANKEGLEEEDENLIEEIRKNIEKPDLIWPELTRLILKSKKRFDFDPLDENINLICEKL